MNKFKFIGEFIKFSDIITPNLTEAMLLSDSNKEFVNIEDVLEMAKNLHEISVQSNYKGT